jgi:hypothetical protein
VIELLAKKNKLKKGPEMTIDFGNDNALFIDSGEDDDDSFMEEIEEEEE